MKTLLIAAPKESKARIHKTLHGHFHYVFAPTLSEALSHVSPQLDGIVCSISFDGDRMFDLLRHVKTHPATASIPFLCIKTLSGSLPESVLTSVELAARSLGAHGLLNIESMRQSHGDDYTFAKIREVLKEMTQPLSSDAHV